jgi:hypothetical protein
MSIRAFAVVGVMTVGTLAAACSQSPAPLSSPNAPSAQQDGNASSPVRQPQPQPEPPPSSGTCVASKAQWTLGEKASAQLLERARLDAEASVARFIRPNEAITMEYHNSRLNLYLNEDEVVHSAVCG